MDVLTLKRLNFFKIKITEKPHTVLLPDLLFLSCNMKFEKSMISMWVGAPQKLTKRHTFQPPSSSKREVCNKPSISQSGTMVAKILDFRLFESLKNALSRTFCSPKLSLESWILHCLRENFPVYTWHNNTNFNNSLFNSTALFMV